MENINNVVENVEVEGGATETVNNEVQAEKTYTQADIDKIIQKRLSRERKDIEAKIEAERKEAEELAKLSEADKQKKLFEKQVKEFEETKIAFERERLLNQTSKDLASKSLPIEFSEMLLGVDAESTLSNINTFESKFNEALEKAVTERMKGKTPKTSTVQSQGTTKDEFAKMTYWERNKLMQENPTLYNELNK
ncbi:MAG: DUF4355 domain-containing protein [Cetobacterium sp.]